MYDINSNMQGLNILQAISQGQALGQNAQDFRRKQQQQQIADSDSKAVADILRGDATAITRLQDPALIQKAQDHLREVEQRRAMQGFYKPATPAQYQANVTQNPLAAIMGGQQQPANLVQRQQPSFQQSQPKNMLDLLQTGKISDGQPASYDTEGLSNYLMGQGDFKSLKDLADYKKSMRGDGNEYYGGLTEGVDPKTGQPVLLAMTKTGAVPSGYAPKPKDGKPVPVVRNGKPVTVQVPETNEVKILMSDGTYMSGGSKPAPKTDRQPAGDLVQTVNGWEFVPKGNVPKGAPIPSAANRPTEDENKATQWAVQAQYATDNMAKIFGANPDAAKQGMIESILPESIANYMRSADRQQFQQSAGSFAEAALRAATGAGVQEAEARQKIAELTPVWGDKPPVIAQKLNSIPLYLASLKVRAGRGLAPVNDAIAKAGNPFDATTPVAAQTPTKNDNGWILHTDKNGVKAYVSPDGKQFQEVK